MQGYELDSWKILEEFTIIYSQIVVGSLLSSSRWEGKVSASSLRRHPKALEIHWGDDHVMGHLL